MSMYILAERNRNRHHYSFDYPLVFWPISSISVKHSTILSNIDGTKFHLLQILLPKSAYYDIKQKTWKINRSSAQIPRSN
jgi:hypothetical protein